MIAARWLLAFASALLAVGGGSHLAAYPKAVDAVGASNLSPYFGNSLKGLWLMDASGMFILAAVCAVLAARPTSTTGAVVVLLGLIPASTATLLYVFIGRFFGAHILIVTAVAMVLAGWRLGGAA